MSKNIQVIPFRRNKEQKTNYRSRLKLLISKQVRFVVRPSIKDITVQLVDYDQKGDKVKLTIRASQLHKHGWTFGTGNLPAAYLAGFWAGSRAKKLGVSSAILDLGSTISVKGSRVYAAIKGARDAGLSIPCDPEILPTDDRVQGKHIAQFAKTAHGLQFAELKKRSAKIEDMPQAVAAVKEKLK